MKSLSKEDHCSVYLRAEEGPRVYLVSTPETRQICNDPLLYGVKYTQTLRKACARALPHVAGPLEEGETSVVHLLRGGLNFGLREALASAFGWNSHSSTFLSAQRRRRADNPEEWEICECEYRKLALPERVSLVLGDVVASGASLLYGIESMLEAVESQQRTLRSILFFTIGGPRSEEVLRGLNARIREAHPAYEGTTVVYFEGCFPVANPETTLRIKITGTDLLRHGNDMTPDFLESQYESALYPLERCTIYDAGSRAFESRVYLEDVLEYWEAVAGFSGVSFEEYLRERCPDLDPTRFAVGSLQELAEQQCAQLKRALSH